MSFQCKGSLHLEPRLQEYIKKKAYYKKNKIEPVVPLEKEFTISREDARRLQAWSKGERDIYNHKKQDRYMDSDDDAPAFEFDPEEVYKADPRYKHLLKKVKRDKDAMKQRHAGDLDAEYENAFHPITDVGGGVGGGGGGGGGDDVGVGERVNRPPHRPVYRSPPPTSHTGRDSGVPRIFDGRDLNFGVDTRRLPVTGNKYRYEAPTSNRIYSDVTNVPGFASPFNGTGTPPTIDYHTRMYPMQNNEGQMLPVDHDPRMREIIGELDSYGTRINGTYQRTSEMDTDMKVVIPTVNSNGKRSANTSSYRPVPYMGRAEGIRDINRESEMQCSRTTRGSKSYGYYNPVEHYFDYISKDIQDPDHVVLERGLPTRLDNRKVARPKPYKRDVL